MIQDAYIVAAARTAGGKKNGSLRNWHPADLGAAVINQLVANVDCDPADIDDVIAGCVSQVGAQTGNVGRNIVLSSNLPESVPGTTVDRQCGSSQQAFHFAIQAVLSGTQDVVIACGVEVMSLVPIGAAVVDGYKAGHGQPYNSKGIEKRYPGVRFNQFAGAEMIAKKWGMKRTEIDRFSAESHRRATQALEQKYFADEIVPIEGEKEGGEKFMLFDDEGVRRDCSFEGLSGLKNLMEEGVLTAGSSSQICDGASGVMVVNKAGLEKLGVEPIARIVNIALAGDDPVIMLTGPIPATATLLKRANMKIQDVDLYEINEAFAPVPMAWMRETGAEHEKLNITGGAIALGHPLGATGTKLMTTLVHNLKRTGGKYGLQAICEGGGTANAALIELC